MYLDNENQKALIHYGVKGMKWRVKKKVTELQSAVKSVTNPKDSGAAGVQRLVNDQLVEKGLKTKEEAAASNKYAQDIAGVQKLVKAPANTPIKQSISKVAKQKVSSISQAATQKGQASVQKILAKLKR